MARYVAPGAHNNATDMYLCSYAFDPDGRIIPSDSSKVTDPRHRRWLLTWDDLEDSAAVFMVYCLGDLVRWVMLRRPEPCLTEEQYLSIERLARGFRPRQEEPVDDERLVGLDCYDGMDN